MFTIILITLITIAANWVGTISGFGLGTIMMPILLLWLPFTQVIFLVCIIHWFHDIWKMIFFMHGIDWRLFVWFGLPSIGASFLGALLVYNHDSTLTVWLGVFLIAYVFVLWFMPEFSLEDTWYNSLFGGAVSGFFAGIFGIRGAVRSVFLTSLDLKKATYLGTIGAISFLLDSTRMMTYYVAQHIRLEYTLFWGLALFIPASFLGTWIGQWSIAKIPQRHFRLVVTVFLFLVGLKLLLTPLF
jgi:uncharacterized membrane protein YfcA